MPNLNPDKQVLQKFVKNLGGKDYLQVGGRVFAAHDARQFVGYDSELTVDDTHYRFKATVTVLNSHLPNYESLPDEFRFGTFVGYSQSPKKGGKSAEGTNPLEVAETSALGRALGFAGFGDLESIASAEEIIVAQSRKATADGSDLASLADKKRLAALLESKLGLTERDARTKYITEKAGVAADRLTVGQVARLISDVENPTETF